MTVPCRVIPCLDVAAGRVVKGRQFVHLEDQGDPAELAAAYARDGADELVFLDVLATVEQRGPLLHAIRRTARRVFVPLTVGGGVRSTSDARALLRQGADRVAMNSAAVADPGLVARAARQFGRQAVVVAIDARRRPWGWEVVVAGGRQPTGLDAIVWAERAAALGAGELLVTSIDRDGTGAGFDIELLRRVTAAVDVPVIASGGAAGPDDAIAAVRDGGASAVLAASIFHRRRWTIAAFKARLAAAGIRIRPVEEAGSQWMPEGSPRQ